MVLTHPGPTICSRAGVGCCPSIRKTGPHNPQQGPTARSSAAMSDQGLSIFDDNEPEEDETRTAEDDATQVMPAVPPRGAEATAPAPPARTAPSPVIPPRPAPSATQSAPPAASPAALPVVRRGGYDRDAVDTQIRQLSGEKA